MTDEVLTWLTMAMSDTFSIACIAAFGWGVISIILSPCHLSSIPLIIGYIGNQNQTSVKRSIMLSFIFSIGILITIGLIGAITASAGRMIGDVGIWGNIIVSGVFIVVGLYLMDIIALSWGRFVPQTSFGGGWKGALLLGLIFGIGLGPCTFAYMAPVLGVVLSISTTNVLEAFSLIAAFGLGHCAVIVAAGSAAGTVQKYLHWTSRSKGATYMKRIAGILVVLAGVYSIYIAFS
jgi:cytochrome c-type biogenesis protein